MHRSYYSLPKEGQVASHGLTLDTYKETKMAIVKTQNALLLHYNNYFNRTIKKLDTVQEYRDADSTNDNGNITPHYKECYNINFNPGDDVATSLILGFGTNPAIDTNDFDYCVIVDVADDEEQHTVTYSVNSRWFVQDINRTRKGQWEVRLRRDVIADNYDAVLDATTYIEKGNVSAGNKFIYNKEGMLFNQIKQKEEQLRDKSNCAWLVGYISKNATASNVTINYSPANQDFIEVSASNISN